MVGKAVTMAEVDPRGVVVVKPSQLPAFCPNPAMPLWSWHPRVYLDVAPTGKSVTFSGVNIFRFRPDGKVAEIWNHRDDLGLMEQVSAPLFAGAAPASKTDLAEPTAHASSGNI